MIEDSGKLGDAPCRRACIIRTCFAASLALQVWWQHPFNGRRRTECLLSHVYDYLIDTVKRGIQAAWAAAAYPRRTMCLECIDKTVQCFDSTEEERVLSVLEQTFVKLEVVSQSRSWKQE